MEPRQDPDTLLDTERRSCEVQQCKAGDYDTWSPPSPGQCLLGRNFTINRRKPDSKCFNSYDADLESSVKPCNCSGADIECEFGYEWSGTDCIAVPHVEAKQCAVSIFGYGLLVLRMRVRPQVERY